MFRITKADIPSRCIFARIDETPDKAGEIFDYASSKPYFEKWSEDIRKASGDKNLGNIRGQHGKVAAGMIVDIAFNDVETAIEFTAEIVDDEWNKIEKGVYTGVSPGGRGMARWSDGKHRRYTLRPSEISLVDVPCISSATFWSTKGPFPVPASRPKPAPTSTVSSS